MRPRLAAMAMAGLVLLSSGNRPAWAEDALPPPFQAVLLLKALAYDQSLKARAAGGTVRVVILARADEYETRGAAAGVLEAMRQASGGGVAGLPLDVKALTFSSLPALEAGLMAAAATALWVSPGLADQLPGVAAVARRHAVMTAGPGESSARAGLTLGLASRDGKPQLFVNLGAARAEGVKLDSGLLRLAQVIP